MKDRPILFNGAMVRAILAGTKTQTRRVMKAVKHPDFGNLYEPSCMAREEQHAIERACPYGQPGDRLWVRETFQPLLAEGFDFRDACWETGKGYAPRYVATEGAAEWIDPDDNIGSASKPSIHMPRWASRITLEITSVRVERLKDVSEADAQAEGVTKLPGGEMWTAGGVFDGPLHATSAVGAFRRLWQQINGADSWGTNPWVWVVEFKRVEQQR